MKELFILFSLVLCWNYSSAQRNFDFGKDHDALLVKDLEASVDFYNGILGLKEIPNGGLPDHIRWFQLNNKVEIHLKESGKKIQHQKGVHYALKTANLEEFMHFLKSKNVHFENRDHKKNSANTRPDGVKQIYLQDPNGYWIEINNSK